MTYIYKKNYKQKKACRFRPCQILLIVDEKRKRKEQNIDELSSHHFILFVRAHSQIIIQPLISHLNDPMCDKVLDSKHTHPSLM